MQEDVSVEGIPALRYVPPVEALQVNTRDNIGFCIQTNPDVDWETCVQNTTDPDILNIDKCYEDLNYR